MTAPSEYAKNATVALHEVLGISLGNFDTNGAASIIDRAIRHATRERQTKARRQLKRVQAAAQERLGQLLSASPAVIYASRQAAILRRPLSARISSMCSVMRLPSTWGIRPSGATGSTPTI